MDESQRQCYLKHMGITQWQLRSDDNNPAVDQLEHLVSRTELSDMKTPDIVPKDQKPTIPDNRVTTSEQSDSAIKGLNWLNQGSNNGLLVVFSDSQKELTTEARQLMSKMLKAIHFLPAETGFAVAGNKSHSDFDSVSLDAVKIILALGHEAGRQLVKICGARIIPGTEIFSLQQRKIIISTHPNELLNDSSLKQQTWKDLKQLVDLFNNS